MELELLCSAHCSRFVGRKAGYVRKMIQKTSPDRETLSNCLFIACLGTSEPSDVAEVLLEHGADPDYLAESGYSAFQHVCRNGDLPKVMLLHRYGANLDLLSERGESPVYLARKCAEVLDFLLQHGAETEIEPRSR
jgi:hypothetical protein